MRIETNRSGITLYREEGDKRISHESTAKGGEMAQYTLYWRTGDREVVEGSTVAQAMTLAGYGGGSVPALDFYADGDNNQYVWNAESREWDRKASA